MDFACIQIEEEGEGKGEGVFVVVIVHFKKTKNPQLPIDSLILSKAFPDPGSPNKLKFIENAFKK